MILDDRRPGQGGQGRRGQRVPQLGGQTCTAWTRMLVPPSRCTTSAVDAGRDAAAKYTVGRPVRRRRPGSGRWSPRQRRPGPRLHRQRASPRAPGWSPAAPAARGRTRGYFVRADRLRRRRPRTSTIAQEEIFGPVLSIIPYGDEDEAVGSPTARGTGWPAGSGRGDPDRAVAFARADAHRPGRHQRRRVQPVGAVRRLQAVRHRPRARPVRPGGVPEVKSLQF